MPLRKTLVSHSIIKVMGLKCFIFHLVTFWSTAECQAVLYPLTPGWECNLPISPHSAWVNASKNKFWQQSSNSQSGIFNPTMTPSASPIPETPSVLQAFISGSDLWGSVLGPVQRYDTENRTISCFYTADATFVTCGSCGSEGRMKTRPAAFSRLIPEQRSPICLRFSAKAKHHKKQHSWPLGKYLNKRLVFAKGNVSLFYSPLLLLETSFSRLNNW